MLLPAGHQRPHRVEQRRKGHARAAEQVWKRGWQAQATEAEVGQSTELRGRCQWQQGSGQTQEIFESVSPFPPSTILSHVIKG